MGRRSLHSADELRELILTASTELIEDSGLAGLSAREIARRINYSPGTLYNSFVSLDELVLTIEGRLLDRLAQALAAVPDRGAPAERVGQLAEGYLAFATENPKLWNLLFEHHMPVAQPVPDWYQQKLEAPIARIEDALRPLENSLAEDELRRAARVLWAGVHGIASLAAADKLANISADDAPALMRDLVRTYLAGLTARGAQD